MKIALAQIKPIKGAVQKNIEIHLDFIQRAIAKDADLIVFPELSITSYEPTLAKELALNIHNQLFDPFQKLSDEHNITIIIGAPTTSHEGVKISAFILQPNSEQVVYSKQILHEDELPYFICGDEDVVFEVRGKKIAFGICYESLQVDHVRRALENGAEYYVASVSKPQNGIDKAYQHFSKLSREFTMPILMANSTGECDTFMSVGQSAAWNAQGVLINQLSNNDENLLIINI